MTTNPENPLDPADGPAERWSQPIIELDTSELGVLIPARVRTIAYATAFTLGILAAAAGEIVPLWVPEHADAVAQTVARIASVVALVTGALGTAYRPTR